MVRYRGQCADAIPCISDCAKREIEWERLPYCAGCGLAARDHV